MNQIFTNEKLVLGGLYYEKSARKAVNCKLDMLGKSYYVGLTEPLLRIDSWLHEEGFTALSDGVYCGEDGRIHEQVGPHTWLSLTWYRMESGRYEIVAYLS